MAWNGYRVPCAGAMLPSHPPRPRGEFHESGRAAGRVGQPAGFPAGGGGLRRRARQHVALLLPDCGERGRRLPGALPGHHPAGGPAGAGERSLEGSRAGGEPLAVQRVLGEVLATREGGLGNRAGARHQIINIFCLL